MCIVPGHKLSGYLLIMLGQGGPIKFTGLHDGPRVLVYLPGQRAMPARAGKGGLTQITIC